MAQAGQIIGFAVAGGAGILSFASPCVLPIVPGYLSFVSGVSIADEATVSRRRVLWSAALFCLGFSLVFVALGATASVFGQALLRWRPWIARSGGAVVALLGFHMMGVFEWPVFDRDTRLHLERKPFGGVGSMLIGMTFAAGWSPCLGPILGGILTYAAATGTVTRGMALLAAYSIGLAAPFLLAAVATERVTRALQKRRALVVWTTRVAGLVLVIVGLLLFTGSLARLASELQALTPATIRARL